ncbi:G/T mismatch-specific thymine DNA glycosylase [Oryzias melastigma]|uniref:G/T mismatch-specific thymine DNA glycosylase n=2 Tax=Oryzias melastigma TaxID=30732 RepID=A0A3B3BC12_ORYME|nr:G/T mismatch-specific thymine DNA glycosylase isoform X1 [Oryzias melastigma]KAF6721506.1 G/T mismatch-specific thymine DNA glycosylase [Oryzias melastigma]
MYDSYQYDQHQLEEQSGDPYRSMDFYSENPTEESVMRQQPVHCGPSLHQEPRYSIYPPPSNHNQVQPCQQSFREHQYQHQASAPNPQQRPASEFQHHYPPSALHHPQQHQQTSSEFYPQPQQNPSALYHPYHQQQPNAELHSQQHQHHPSAVYHPYHQSQQQTHAEQHSQHHPSALSYPHYQMQEQPPSQLPPQHQYTVQQGGPSIHFKTEPSDVPPPVTPVKKKRGRPSKQQTEEETPEAENEIEAAKKAKRTLNRFNGMSVEEVMAKTLPDVITYDLDILIIGINPGLLSAFKGHHYPNPGNHFWKCLFLSGLTEQQLNYMHDQSLPEKYSIGFTNMVERTTPGSKDLSSKEIREGGRQLLEKLQKYKPLIAAFNGKGIYEIFCKEIFGVKAKNLDFGLQPYKIPETQTVCFLMPSSSPRCAQFPRAQDKVHFYIKLKDLRDQMKGLVPGGEVMETQYSFDLQLAKEDAKRLSIKEEQVDPEYESCAGLHSELGQSS